MEHKTNKYLHKICKYLFLCSVSNFWTGALGMPNKITKLLEWLSVPNGIVICSFIVSEFAALFTQNHLTEKQKSDNVMFLISHILMYGCYLGSITLYQNDLASVVHSLAHSLKKHYNDETVEMSMINKSKVYGVLYVTYVVMAAGSYGLDGIIQAAKKDATFTTVIPAWPDTTDTSLLAGIARIVIYFVFILFLMRTSAIYFLVLVLSICLSHQYQNLQSYFYSLNQIFERDLDQDLKEAMYERSLKIGLQLHAETLRCTAVAQRAFQIVYCGQVILSIIVLTLSMTQLTASERSFTNTLTTLTIAGSVLFITGMFMWNAGNITVEASRLPSAMFHSGWQNCHGAASYRARRLLVMAMTQGQVPVVMKVLGILELSYASYVTIIKTSYSVFSVIY